MFFEVVKNLSPLQEDRHWTQNYTQTLDLCMLHDRLPSINEQICGHLIMAITRASQVENLIL